MGTRRLEPSKLSCFLWIPVPVVTRNSGGIRKNPGIQGFSRNLPGIPGQKRPEIPVPVPEKRNSGLEITTKLRNLHQLHEMEGSATKTLVKWKLTQQKIQENGYLYILVYHCHYHKKDKNIG
jgi:hypothetical protein